MTDEGVAHDDANVMTFIGLPFRPYWCDKCSTVVELVWGVDVDPEDYPERTVAECETCGHDTIHNRIGGAEVDA